MFNNEAAFEKAFIELLTTKGWESEVLRYPTEKTLLDNWASILFENNRDIDRLNDFPLTDSEMQQIMEQITALKTPLKLNGFINGKTVAITRDNPADTLHLGKEISLKIYDRREIAAGQSRYQIVQQPQYKSKSKMLHDRRGDLMLLINGMPVFHIELKGSNVPVSKAYQQIEHYSKEGIFTGIFSLIQIFVAMQPEEAVYFANPGEDGKFNKDFYFHWADFNNEPLNHWKDVTSSLLSIPMAHQLIGFYSVADDSDGVLKVMRSYQYYAANAISDKVSKTDWKSPNALGGFIWHTTGSGKTMTSFKSAQLIANSKDADKVIFLMDRIELGTQSLIEYRGFADADESVQATENTDVLVSKFKSSAPQDVLIVTSIQKMSNIKDEEGGFKARDIELMTAKRVVFIVDEAHRSTFGDMLINIKATFPAAIFFGFTGTPIQEENQKKMNTTSSVFGNELHRYSIADGIRDKNVLGFDPYKVLTYKDRDLRLAVALERTRAADETEVFANPRKIEVFNEYMQEVPMAGSFGADGSYIRGIEDEIPRSQYERAEHQRAVVNDILENWVAKSQNSKFHAIFATSSIPEAMEYYQLIKALKPDLKVTALFDSTIDDNGNGSAKVKQDGLVEILENYNERYEQDFTLKSHAGFKKNVSARLAHKKPYKLIERTPDQQIDLLIVVDQMLTGFDSKWVNTLYLDKVLKYENVIQAFSRTNRLFGPDKLFGTIRYYRYPHTMEQHIKRAVKLYSGDKPFDLFADKLAHNLHQLNGIYVEITELFDRAGVHNFEKLPDNLPERGRFAKLFSAFNTHLEAAKVQGFKWNKADYKIKDEDGKVTAEISMVFDENSYLILALRYKELFSGGENGGGGADTIPFEIDSHLTEIDTERIDADYMNSRFEKYLRTLRNDGSESIQETLDELHKSFASLTQEQQKYANIFIHDVQSGTAKLETDKTFREYITSYQSDAKDAEIDDLSQLLSLDKLKLTAMMNADVSELNINEYGRFDELKESVDKTKAKEYFEKLEGKNITAFKINIRVHNLLQEFILKGGFKVGGVKPE